MIKFKDINYPRRKEKEIIINLPNEIWKDVCDGYKVSNYGRVLSLAKTTIRGRKYDKILSASKKDNGYYTVSINGNNEYVHRLVAKAFIDNPNNLNEINHKDEDKSNNRVDNLEWCSLEYNINYGTSTRRRSIKMGKRIYAYSLKGEFLATYFSIREAERVTGVKKQSIMPVIDKNKTAGEMFWRTYMSDNIEAKAPKNHKLHIVQYDMQSKKIASYSSAHEAERKTGIKHEYICKCIRGIKESCGGFIWRKAYG